MKFLETGNKYKTNKIQISYKHDRNQSKIQNKNNRNKIQIQMVAADKIADCKVWMKYVIFLIEIQKMIAVAKMAAKHPLGQFIPKSGSPFFSSLIYDGLSNNTI